MCVKFHWTRTCFYTICGCLHTTAELRASQQKLCGRLQLWPSGPVWKVCWPLIRKSNGRLAGAGGRRQAEATARTQVRYGDCSDQCWEVAWCWFYFEGWKCSISRIGMRWLQGFGLRSWKTMITMNWWRHGSTAWVWRIWDTRIGNRETQIFALWNSHL